MIQSTQTQEDSMLDFLKDVPLTELHAHMGFSVSPEMLWEMAHREGIRLPTKNFNEFKQTMVIYDTKPYEEYIAMYDLPEKIQSSPSGMLMALETAVSGAFRSSNIRTIEIRFDPMLRVRKGERDMDHIIVYAIHGMERAMLKYPIKAGIILEMDRRFNQQENMAIVDKAIKYKHRGIIGIDLAGPLDRFEQSRKFKPHHLKEHYQKAKAAGLGTTFHTGEATGIEEMWEVVETINPDRIGHGLACRKDKTLMQRIVAENIILENCPTSNLKTQTIKDYSEMQSVFQTFKDQGIKFTINTDGPEMLQTNLREEYRRLLVNKVLTKADLLHCNQIAQASTFINN